MSVARNSSGAVSSSPPPCRSIRRIYSATVASTHLHTRAGLLKALIIEREVLHERVCVDGVPARADVEVQMARLGECP